MGIRYLYKEGEEACSKEPLPVSLDGIYMGNIKKVDGGFQYFPRGSKTGGEVCKSVVQVQQSMGWK